MPTQTAGSVGEDEDERNGATYENLHPMHARTPAAVAYHERCVEY